MKASSITQFASDVEQDIDFAIASINTTIDALQRIKIGVSALADAMMSEDGNAMIVAGEDATSTGKFM